MKKKFVLLVLMFVMCIKWSAWCIIPLYAHESVLNIYYDDCQDAANSDGIDEMWYALDDSKQIAHLSHTEITIKYYFYEPVEDDDCLYTWTTEISEELANEIKDAYAESMKKWNNVYFYSYDDLGNVVKKKIVNIIEGTAKDHNLCIYPSGFMDDLAITGPINDLNMIENNTIPHYHPSDWAMTVSLYWFYQNSLVSDISLHVIREGTGAHEMGHVLGLRDLDRDNLCRANAEEQHHTETLMGYGQTISSRCYDITYKDIAGVAIARGFHTDSDHKWLNAGQQSDGTYKLICSICNGVKYVESLNGYVTNTYGLCDGEHDIQSGNMMAVASYGTKDYYKCKYCRYVAPFDDIVEQNYVYSSVSSTQHQCTNEVDGLRYSFLEAHTYGRYFTPNNKFFHNSHCDCGHPITQRHVISPNDVGQTNQWCKYCGELLMGSGTLNGVYSDYPHTENGSYILPSGIIVLVPEDEEAYLNGTLEFRTGEIM